MRIDYNSACHEITRRMKYIINEYLSTDIYKHIHAEQTRFGVYFSKATSIDENSCFIGETITWAEWDTLTDAEIAAIVRCW